MGLFEKKYCDICGGKVGMLTFSKLEDGNICADCKKKLSPFFTGRKKSTVDEIKAQLEYREQNRKNLDYFNATRTFGRRTKIYLDDNQQKFVVSSRNDFREENADIIDISRVNSARYNIEEHRSEQYRTDSDGKRVSYNPPRYDYSYEFEIIIGVTSPYFSEIKFELSDRRPDSRYSDLYRQFEQEANAIVSALNGNAMGGMGMNNMGMNNMGMNNNAFSNAGAMNGMNMNNMNGMNGMNGTGFAGAAMGGMNAGMNSGMNMSSMQSFNLPFGVQSPVPYYENINGNGVTLEIKYFGTAEVYVSNPAAFQNYGSIEAIQDILRTDIITAVNETLFTLSSSQNVSVSRLPACQSQISNEAKAKLENRWQAQYGLGINNIAFNSISLTPESQQQYYAIQNNMQQQQFSQNYGQQYQQPQQGFNQQYQQQGFNQQYQQPQNGAWFCPNCGTRCTTKFCQNCGTPRQ